MADPWPTDTTLIDWKDSSGYTVTQAAEGCMVWGSTGSGKSSGPLSLISRSYFKARFGALILLAKQTDKADWLAWAAATGRTHDVRIFSPQSGETFDFLSWQVAQTQSTGAQVINTVELLEEIGTVAARSATPGAAEGENAFFKNALHLHLSALISLAVTSGEPVTIPRLRELAAHAARLLLRLAEEHALAASTPERLADIAELFAYWTGDFVALSSRTRSIIDIMLSTTFMTMLYSPLRNMFTSGKSTVTPQDCCNGAILIIDLAAQQYKLAGIIASLVWKKCMQNHILSRTGARGTLRPVAIFADEYQLWATPGDADYQATCRSNMGCSVFLTQQRESLTRVLGEDTTENLLSNLQTKFICQSTGQTALYASRLIGGRYVKVIGTGTGDNYPHDPTGPPGSGSTHSSINSNEQMRAYLEPSFFQALKKGGSENENMVEAVVFSGGKLFTQPNGEKLPYKVLIFRQGG